LLSKEKQRLETELTCLEKRQWGIHERLAKIVQEMNTLELELERRRSSDDPSADIRAEGKRPATPSQCKQPWKKMTVDY
jgi:regulator of replication initiation timing